ncbi:MAG: hypothetical protein LH630_10740, partial [Actinomycetia bacterium]|nr:hypothetical protein [Actinomycetes bacterium]
MRRFVRASLVLLVLAAGMVVPTTAAQACSCARVSDERMLRFSDAVFYGEVAGRSPVREDQSQVPQTFL